MQKEKIENVLFRILRMGMFALFLAPLIIGPFGWNVADYPKAIFFRCFVEIFLVFYLALVLVNSKYLPKKSPILGVIVLFYVLMFASSIFGINFNKSFFGDLTRSEGLIFHLHLLAFFIITIGIFKDKDEWLGLLKATVVVSALSSLAAILQQLKIYYFYAIDPVRVSGTLSNPGLFASYITLSLFITFFLLAAENKKELKILWLSLIVLNGYTLFMSGTRAAWLGLFCGLALLVVLNFKKLSREKRIATASGVAIVAVFLLSVFFAAPLIKNFPGSNMLQRATTLSLGDRVVVWKTAFRAFLDRPVLGWGFETFAYVSDKYFENPVSGGISFDRAHSKVFELLEYGGILGLASYLLIFIVIFYSIFKCAKSWDGHNGRPKALYASILAGFLVCYFIQNLFSFDHIGTYINFFLIAGLVNNTFCDFKEFSFAKKIETLPNFVKTSFFCAFLIFSIWVLFQVNIKPTMANMYFPESGLYKENDISKRLYWYEKAISMNTIYDNELKLIFTYKTLSLLDQNPAESIRKEAISKLSALKPFLYEDIENKSGQTSNFYRQIAAINGFEYSINKNPETLKEMESVYQKAMAFNPGEAPLFYHGLGELKILQNNYGQGEEYIAKSCDIEPACANKAEPYIRIGSAYDKKGDYKMAVKNFQKAIDIDYEQKIIDPKSESMFQNPIDSIVYTAILYCRELKDLNSCQKILAKETKAYPEYADTFKQYSVILSAGYKK